MDEASDVSVAAGMHYERVDSHHATLAHGGDNVHVRRARMGLVFTLERGSMPKGSGQLPVARLRNLDAGQVDVLDVACSTITGLSARALWDPGQILDAATEVDISLAWVSEVFREEGQWATARRCMT